MKYLCILGKLRRKELKYLLKHSLSFDSEGNELHLEDVLGTKEDIVTKPIEDEFDKYLMYKEVDKLGKRDKEIIELRYGLNGKKEMTQKEVANLLGISQSYISRIEKKVIKKLSNIIKIIEITFCNLYNSSSSNRNLLSFLFKLMDITSFLFNNFCIISLDRLSLSESTVIHKSILILPFSVSFISKLVMVL